MGPTNVALVTLLRADNALRAAQEKLETAARAVRIGERRIADLQEKLQATQTRLREQQAQSNAFELDVKTRDARIDRLRTQQQNTKNNKEYQAFLTEINTEKIDKAKSEEEELKAMQLVENSQKEAAEFEAQLATERTANGELRDRLGSRLAELQTEVDRLRPAREEAAAAVPARAREAFDRLADRYEGEAMAPISKPNRRQEQYICTSCNMELVVDIYNRLHSRDEMVFCANCHRILYIPDDLPPETALNTKPARKEKAAAE